MQEAGRYRIFVTLLIVVEDLFLINILYFILLYFFQPNSIENHSYQILQILLNLSYLVSTTFTKIASDIRQMNMRAIIRRAVYRVVITMFISLSCLFLTKISQEISRLFIIIFFPLLLIVMIFAHYITKKILSHFLGSEKNGTRAVILGAGVMGNKLYEELTSNTYLGINVLGFFDDAIEEGENKILGTIDSVKEFVKENKVNKIFCTLPLSAKDKIIDIMEFSDNHVVNFHIVPTVRYYTNTPVVLETMGNMPILSMRKIPLNSAHNAMFKRICDIVISFVFLISLFPIIYIILGCIIKLSSRGPIFFTQERTGLEGKNFKCHKFRSMRCNNDADKKQATENDVRKTKVGNFIRKTNLDELPQFINVLKGEMSIVGPRPHMLLHTSEYSQIVNKYMVRHFIKPGITGWAQINGYRGETKEVAKMEGRIRKDIWYIENWSIMLDLEIIFKTIWVTLKGDKKAF